MGLGTSRTWELSAAIEQGDHRAVEELLSSGLSANAMINFDDVNGPVSVSALYYSIKQRNCDIMKLLISGGADVNLGCIGNDYSQIEYPIHCACRLGNMAIAQYLLDHGCDVNAVDQENRTPIFVAIDNRNPALVELLLSRPEIKLTGECKQQKNKQRELHRACSTGMSEVVTLLLRHGSKVNVVDEFSVTPLYLACQNGFTDIVTMLLNAGADPNIRRNCEHWKDQNYSPLHVAIKGGHCEIVKSLLAADAHIDETEFNGRTGLFLACQEGNVDIVRTLLEEGADPNVKSNNVGQTPLFCALNSGLYQIRRRVKRLKNTSSAEGFSKYDSHSFVVEILELLLNHGARHDILDNSGYTACDYSIMLGQVDTTCILLQHGAAITSSCYSCTTDRWDDFTISKILLLHSRDFVPLVRKSLQRASEVLQKDVAEELDRPPSLSRLCRYKIRNLIQAKTAFSLFPLIDNLPVPNTLKKFLKLEDAYDVIFT